MVGVKDVSQANSQPAAETVNLIPEEISQEPEVKSLPSYLQGDIISLKMPSKLESRYSLRDRKKRGERYQE